MDRSLKKITENLENKYFVIIKEREPIYVNTIYYIEIVIICSTFHHYIVYNSKGINTKEWFPLLTTIRSITIIQKTISQS
jgi:hypothetical protein